MSESRSELVADGPGAWRSRGYLPHLDRPGLVQSVTFRLADALPAAVLESWRGELARLDAGKRRLELRRLTESYLDRGAGSCHLRDPRVAAVVETALMNFDGERYRLLAWCVMPNHVHSVIETIEGFSLGTILHSWKSFTATITNRILRRRGTLWQREYHDRYVRDEAHLTAAVGYVEHNPVAARLVSRAEEWRWSSAWRRSGMRPFA